MIKKEFERGYISTCEDESCSDIRQSACINKLNVYNWLANVTDNNSKNKYVEVRFKNTRKGIYENHTGKQLEIGDLVAVEASPGHDIGIVSAINKIALFQLERYKQANSKYEIKKVYRKARPSDIQKWREAIALEYPTMLKTREFANEFNLTMKIGDVEYQGDKTKAIFYYIAEERVDFRLLIKKMAESFCVKIEMKQIGARQEAGRIGAIGPCGREICCTTWLSRFNSVSTNSARIQELSLNPQKLAGQCSKLKCCLNYELPIYLDARKTFPDNVELKTKQGVAVHVKNDIFKNLMYYEIIINNNPVIQALDIVKVKEIIDMNAKGIIPDDVFDAEKSLGTRAAVVFKEELNSDSLTRFDDTKKIKHKKKHNNNKVKKLNKNISKNEN